VLQRREEFDLSNGTSRLVHKLVNCGDRGRKMGRVGESGGGGMKGEIN
jgi:hypothetical protein